MKRLCPDVEMIGDYIEGHLNTDDRSGIEEHLSECETCRQEFIIGKNLVRGGDDLDLSPVPDEVFAGNCPRCSAPHLPWAVLSQLL